MHFKPIISLLFSSLLIFGLSGCGDGAAYMEDDTNVTVPIDMAPVITLLGTNPMTLNIGDTFTNPGATATDREDGDLSTKIITTGIVDTSKDGTYHVTYTVTDSAGNKAIVVRNVIVMSGTTNPPIDSLPVITLLGTNPMTLNIGDTFTDPGATATDKEDGDLTTKIVTIGIVDTSKDGTYHVTYTVTDSAGNKATVVRNVIVTSGATTPVNTPPTIILLGASPMNIMACDNFIDPGATANDKEDGDLTSKIGVSGTVDITIPGTYTITYTVSDSGGLSATTTRDVIVSLPTSKIIKITGQKVSYDESGTIVKGCALKDDGFYKVGAIDNYTRANDIVTDLVTGLKWEDTPHTGGTDGSNLLMLWNGTNGTAGGPAEGYCANLTLGGLTWRLPEIWELLTIADKSRHNPAINPIFQNMIAGPYSAERLYWTKTPKQGTPVGTTTQINYNVKFVDGRDQAGLEGYVGNPKSVRCVSGTATGSGLAPSNRSFSRDSASEIVTDNIAEIQWTDDTGTNGQSGTWKEAIDYCENLVLGGFDDWRLPNLNEWYSIAKNTGLKDQAFDPVFTNITGNHHVVQYWSSTTVDEYRNAAWLFEFYLGTDTWSAKDSSLNNEPPASRPGAHTFKCVRNK
jgi:PKD repeat protein